MPQSAEIFSFALMLPVYHQFDYAVPSSISAMPGQRFVLPFGRGEKVGILVSVVDQSEFPVEKLKSVLRPLDEQPVAEFAESIGEFSDRGEFPLGCRIAVWIPFVVMFVLLAMLIAVFAYL